MLEIPPNNTLTEICRRYNVRHLELFGSAATKQFDPDHSDIDFLVEFNAQADLGPWMKRYFALRQELSQLYEREVDLVMSAALRNDQMRREAGKTRTIIYDASKDGQVAE